MTGERIDSVDARLDAAAWADSVTRRTLDLLTTYSQFADESDFLKAWRWAGYVAQLLAEHADCEGLVVEFEWPESWPEASGDVVGQVQQALELLEAEGYIRSTEHGFQLTVPSEVAVSS